METNVYNQKGEKVSEIKLADTVFNLPWNSDLVHQVVVAMTANKRTTVAHTKGRGEVSGGDRKPWRQKGLGKGQTRLYQVSHLGGRRRCLIPRKDKDYSVKINVKAKKKAFFTVLSQKLRDNEILFLDKMDLSKPKTKEAVEIVGSLSKIGGFEKLKTKKTNKAILALDKKRAQCFQELPQHSRYGNLPSPQPQHFGHFEI